MASLLAKLFRESVEKSKDPRDREATFDVSYPTNFLPLDFLNGSLVRVKDGSSYYSVGLSDGSYNTFIGRSGCGKTTLALQAGINIIRPFPGAVLYYDDIEAGSNGSRREILLKLNQDEIKDRIIYRNKGITVENFFKRINEIHDLKIKNESDFLYDTGKLDPLGNTIYIMEPTVYILDSIALLVPDKLSEEEELSGQMSATQIAKSNTQAFKRLIPKLKAANIILIAINHVTDKIDINPFAKTAAQVSYLDKDESLPGGKTVTYLANNIFKLKDSTKLKDTEGLGVYGKIVDVFIIKSRTNNGGKSIPLVFNGEIGFDQELSLLQFMKANNSIVSKGSYMVFSDFSDVKFQQKSFKEKLYTDEEFRNVFMKVARESLKTLIKVPVEENYNEDMISNELSVSNDIINGL